MRERAHCESELIGVVRVAKEADDKVAGADVVGQVREKLVAKRVVAHVLNHAAAVSIGARPVQIGRREIRDNGSAAEERSSPAT